MSPISLTQTFIRYGLLGSLRLLRDLLFTQLFFRGARLVRQPAYLRGKQYIRWGKNFTAGVSNRLDVFANDSEPLLVIGNNVEINDHVHIAAIERIDIGDDVLIASRVFISDHNHGNYQTSDTQSSPDTPPKARPLVSKPVCIGNRVWIGEQVCILPGITIGNGAIVGAGSVVTRDVPANTIVAGNPARVIRTFNLDIASWEKA